MSANETDMTKTEGTETNASVFTRDMTRQEWWDAMCPLARQAVCGLAVWVAINERVCRDRVVDLDDLMYAGKIRSDRTDEVKALFEEMSVTEHVTWDASHRFGEASLTEDSYIFALEREDEVDKARVMASKFNKDMTLTEWWDAMCPLGRQAVCGVAAVLESANAKVTDAVHITELMCDGYILFEKQREVEIILEDISNTNHFVWHDLEGVPLVWLMKESYPFVLEHGREVMEAAKAADEPGKAISAFLKSRADSRDVGLEP